MQVVAHLVVSGIVVVVGSILHGLAPYALLACVGYTIVFAFIGIRYFRWNGG
ncbi:hypothetical protein GCM10009715_08980 [Paeniglutamicibacter psychrophenolicus]